MMGLTLRFQMELKSFQIELKSMKSTGAKWFQIVMVALILEISLISNRMEINFK